MSATPQLMPPPLVVELACARSIEVPPSKGSREPWHAAEAGATTYGENDTLLNALLVDCPRNCTATNTTIAISASISAYSIAVAPRSSPSGASTSRIRVRTRCTTITSIPRAHHGRPPVSPDERAHGAVLPRTSALGGIRLER